ncbi:hypothetical protein QQS21_009541 [Conoideocrella luteorostrata]|uniref:Cupin type-1 domain-containing protein n=1 Tax=Conoideocrella luteorostrata TaxID=1105319 RepID=A0AAJ0FUZ5_9HYPO|nr:hypothetical protein QQS21_009541 [Conoideocrella luteorostrata]
MPEIREYHLRPTRLVPNSPRPLLHYKNVLQRNNKDQCNPAEVYEMFTNNGWRVDWIFRYSDTQLSHFHSQAHEVMAVLSGTAVIRFGVGDTSEDMEENTYGGAWEANGIELQAEPGDVFVIPAGVAHKTHAALPKREFKLLSPGKGYGIEAENPKEALSKIELDGYTMIGAYSGGDWDFVKAGGEYENTWGVGKPECDPVYGNSGDGIQRLWKGSDMSRSIRARI